MVVQKDWGVLISQTGSEVIAISKETGFLPSLIVTNNLSKIAPINLEILRENGVNVETIPFKPTFLDYLGSGIMDKKLVTLHGFLRILPASFFNEYKGKIYNGHPALISQYPELKGFNMQEAIVGKKAQYPLIGSVIHEVIPELDAGRIVTSAQVTNVAINNDHAYALLRKTSLETWKYFFSNIWKFG